MSDWVGRLSSALWTFGYETLRTDAVSAAQVKAISAEQQRQRDARVAVAQAGDWAGVLALVQHMRAAGIYTASFRFEYILHLVLGCLPVQGVAVGQVAEFGRVVAPWLHALQAALPREKLNDQGKSELNGLLHSAGIGGTVATLLGSLTEGPTGVDCLMVFPVHGATASYLTQWRGTDLVSEPLEDPSYRCWLWTTEDNAVHPSGHGFAESGRDVWRGHIATPDDLARALRNVTG
ncbi:MAG: hypothetical protein QOE53_2472 [Pseudonocardiales bacterium]|nr:hypothetical protein [Pseudonocardiales bacterium]